MDEEIDPNLLANNRYACSLHIGTILGAWSPSKESGTSSMSSWWMPNHSFLIVDKEIGFLHKNVSILQDKSIYALKITYGNHPWS